MDIEVIRRIAQKRPWRGIELLLDGGETMRIPHPEGLAFGRKMIFVEYRDGSADFCEAASVCKVRRLGRRTNSR